MRIAVLSLKVITTVCDPVALKVAFAGIPRKYKVKSRV